MWTINSYDIFRLRTPGGNLFTEFVDALIKAEAYIGGVPLSNLSTTLRTNVGDGGVDTEIRVAIPTDSTGCLDVPTCWQYKATQNSNVSEADLRKEVKKPYSKELIEKGYGYRLCICDDITAEKRTEWEEILSEEVKNINNSAPAPKILSASNLADWASRLPAVVIRFFQPGLEQLLHLQAWGQNITKLTPTFVEVEVWSSVKQRLLDHADFSKPCNDVILPMQGEAGVGKTRLTYEALVSLEGSESLVLYTIDTKAVEIAYTLANDKSVRAILIADECLLKTRIQLNTLLAGHSNRVRLICLDNSGERLLTDAAEPWLEKIPEDNVDSILKQNFPTVPADRRRAYVELSRGFVKLAADLCNQDFQIAAQGNVRPALMGVRDYLRNRLSPEELPIVEAIAFFWKVGFRDDVKEELDQMCESLNIDKGKVLQTANRLKDVPGFIAFAGRYLYVTPEIIAQVSFEGAWKRCAEYDPPAFLSKIPDSLLESFLKRVSNSGSEEVRRVVGEFFRTWATHLQPIDLTDIQTVNRLVVLAETNPRDYLPRLARLIEKASRDEFLKVSGGIYGRGPRRSLVWLAERMAAFPEFFSYAESILWKLALAETEPNLANNATRIWQELFQIFLSVTATPFAERMKLLQQRLLTEDEQQIALALGGLSRAFETDVSRIVGRPMVAGRIPPEQWQPKTQLELRQCLDLALDVLSQAARSDTPSLREGALHIAIEHLRFFLVNGYLDQIKALFPIRTVSQDVLLLLIDNLEDFLEFNPDAPQEVQEWLQSLIPDNFHGKLIGILGKSPWHDSFRDNQEAWHTEINSIAKQLCEQPELLESEMEWLCSPQARSVWALGNAMGAYDADALCLDLIMRSVADTQATGLAREYIASLLRNYPQHSAAVNAWIDEFETQTPAIAYELFMAGGDATRALERALKLIDTGILSLEYLGGFTSGISGQRPLSNKEFYEILKRLTTSVKAGKNLLAIKTAIKLVASRLDYDQWKKQVDILKDAAIQSLIWELLEATAKFSGGEYYHWDEILRSLAKIHIDKAATIASLAIFGEEQQKIRAEEILAELAESHPDLVMQRVGEVILSKEYVWYLPIEKHGFLIQSLPLEALKNWLRSVGAVGAQRIARNLPIPYLDESGKPVVPPLTEFVLSEFEDDERTFREFCLGSHSLQIYIGDVASQKQKEAEIAREFLNHPLPRVREWAEYEISRCEQDAKMWRQIDEESRI
jgi:hypothetical protein